MEPSVAPSLPHSAALTPPVAGLPTGRLGRARAALLVLGVALLLVGPPLYYRPVIAQSHDARFPLLARDVLARGVLIPEERGLLYRNKPPLFPWSIAVLSWPAGHVSETTALLPVAAGACLAILGTFLLGDALFGRRAGLWAGLILATSYGFFAFAQRPLPDVLVVGLVTLAGYPLWRAVGPAASRPALVGFYALLALGVFAKGPEGLLPLLVALVWCGATAGAPGLRRLWSPAGLAVFVAISLLWGVPLLMHAGDRLAGEVVEPGLWAYLGLPRPVSLAGQLVRFALGFLPWTLLAPLAVSAAARQWRTPAVGFALSWFVVPLAVVFLSHTQRTRYLLPLYPGAALLVAWWAAEAGARVTPIRRALAAAAGLTILVVLAAPLWVRPSPRYFVPAATWASAPLFLALLGAGAALAVGLWRGRPRLLVAGTVTAMVVVLGWGSWLHARWAASTQDYPGLAAQVSHEAGGAPVGAVVIADYFLQLDFYLGRTVTPLYTAGDLRTFLARPERPVAVVEARDWRRLGAPGWADVQIVARWRVEGQDHLIVRGSAP
jgi:4-amino-4-deoxy-L-arabinose transferase-like glycosyltransferase